MNTTYERNGQSVTGSSALQCRKDAVFGHLAQALAFTVDRRSEASARSVAQLRLIAVGDRHRLITRSMMSARSRKLSMRS
ncbi:hypothetical protein [Paraburkholderia bannensis]|nr:hypothetical protein [Paraburkholderia bannensis]MBB3261709.1 hypothetical protein [Paraburkholderia sp. WP4_3_2]